MGIFPHFWLLSLEKLVGSSKILYRPIFGQGSPREILEIIQIEMQIGTPNLDLAAIHTVWMLLNFSVVLGCLKFVSTNGYMESLNGKWNESAMILSVFENWLRAGLV